MLGSSLGFLYLDAYFLVYDRQFYAYMDHGIYTLVPFSKFLLAHCSRFPLLFGMVGHVVPF